VSIVGSKITRGGREWEVASTVRAGAGLRIILKAVDDPDCRILATVDSGVIPDTAADLSDAVAVPDARWFRDQNGALWKVEIRGATGRGTPLGGWLVFASDRGATQVRLRHPSLEGIGSLTDGHLVKLLFEARRTPA
jgi:hypothetical protein